MSDRAFTTRTAIPGGPEPPFGSAELRHGSGNWRFWEEISGSRRIAHSDRASANRQSSNSRGGFFGGELLEHGAESAQDFVGHRGFQNELQHSIGRELRATLRREEPRQLLGIDGGVLTELEGHRIALAV